MTPGVYYTSVVFFAECGNRDDIAHLQKWFGTPLNYISFVVCASVHPFIQVE
jgi:hypothetical protein